MEDSTWGKSVCKFLEFFGSGPHLPNLKKGVHSRGRIDAIGRCRRAGSQRLPRIRTGRKSINAKKRRRNPLVNDFESGVSRVSEWHPFFSRPSLKMSIKPSSLLVVAVLLCNLLDPRDPQQVIVAQGLPPHPGPEPGAVMQEVSIIEGKVQRQADDKSKSSSKQQRCISPSPVREQRNG